jgi:hypothetical protein
MSNPESDALSQQPGDRVGNQTMGVRGVGVGAPRRDGFAGTFGTGTGMNSLFDIERADVVRGPQGLLYGASGAGGTVNIVSKRATFNRNAGRTDFRIDQYGSKQLLFDYNWGTENVAVRVALLNDHQLYRRVFIGYETKGIYSQIAFRVAPLRTVVRVIAGQTENTRVLKWMLGRIEGEAKGNEHVFGITPSYEDLDWSGMDFSLEKFTTITSIDKAAWRKEFELHAELFEKLAHGLPPSLLEIKAGFESRLG